MEGRIKECGGGCEGKKKLREGATRKGETVGRGIGEKGWGRRGVLRGEGGGGVKSGVGRVVGYNQRRKKIRWKGAGESWRMGREREGKKRGGGGSLVG